MVYGSGEVFGPVEVVDEVKCEHRYKKKKHITFACTNIGLLVYFYLVSAKCNDMTVCFFP